MNETLRKLLSTLAFSAVMSCLTITGAAAASLDEMIRDCANCHGTDGVSSEPAVPTLAGLSELFIVDSLTIYRDRERPCIEAEYLEGSNKGTKTDMCKLADEIGDEDSEALAKFYAGKDFVRAKQDFDPDRAARGRKIHGANCEKCHEDGGISAEDDAGVLAGQWMPYLEQTFKSYASGERVIPKKMKPKFEKLTDEGKLDLLHFYASFQ